MHLLSVAHCIPYSSAGLKVRGVLKKYGHITEDDILVGLTILDIHCMIVVPFRLLVVFIELSFLLELLLTILHPHQWVQSYRHCCQNCHDDCRMCSFNLISN